MTGATPYSLLCGFRCFELLTSNNYVDLPHVFTGLLIIPQTSGIINGWYTYTENLLEIERRGAPPPTHQSIIEGFLPEKAWNLYLVTQPDRKFADFLRRGIRYGFLVGYDPVHLLRDSTRNHQSVITNRVAVDQYIQREEASGKLTTTTLPTTVHTNSIGMIPKPHQPGKFCLIVDLSAPVGHSVNDGIRPKLCSINYASVDNAASLVKHYGLARDKAGPP